MKLNHNLIELIYKNIHEIRLNEVHDELRKNKSLVLFYRPFHIRSIRKLLLQKFDNLSKITDIKIIKINLKNDNNNIYNKYNIHSTPSIYLYPFGFNLNNRIKYYGDESIESLLAFIDNK